MGYILGLPLQKPEPPKAQEKAVALVTFLFTSGKAMFLKIMFSNCGLDSGEIDLT
jgi:hypothetical protein